ncbi:MAG: hypothetical protein ACD_5C00356G0008 [uncultured bacterium]|nr:MAG: hypothetical protein ACD_5C00356G0008 [uncultured bacterium]
MIDLTKNIRLDKNSQKKYMLAKTTMYAGFVLGMIIVANKILFPSQTLNLFFENLNAAKNTIVNPRFTDGKIPSKGNIAKDNTLIFNANPLGNFSSVEINFHTADKQDLSNSTVWVQKSYQAFFYPIGKPLGFKNGSLLTTQEGEYYIVSNGTLRRFANTNVILTLGFPKTAFTLVTNEDLKYNQTGEDITSLNSYPNGTLFVIDEKFYQLENGKLLAFVSDRAFLSEYQSIQAISKNRDFFNDYPLSENPLGFADGTIASAGGSAFILSGGKSYPIADFNTFEVMGFSWDNVIALESDEMGAYEQQKQFTLDQPHPNGIIFSDKNTNEYFIIDNGSKRPIKSQAILKTYQFQNEIAVDSNGSLKKLSCKLNKKIFPFKTYSCEIKLEEISSIIGNDYQLEAKLISDSKLKEINLNFSTPLSWKNMMTSLSKIKGNLQSNYSAQ